MKTYRVKFHHENPGLCQTTFIAVGERRYFNRIEGENADCWYVVYPSLGHWENSHEVSEDVEFEVVDQKGNVLFHEGNASLGAFQSIGTMARTVAAQWRQKLGLLDWSAWKSWLLKEKPPSYQGYDENYLFWLPETLHSERLGEYDHLGLRFEITSILEEHPLTGQIWRSVHIFNKKDGNCEAICGFELNVIPPAIPGQT